LSLKLHLHRRGPDTAARGRSGDQHHHRSEHGVVLKNRLLGFKWLADGLQECIVVTWTRTRQGEGKNQRRKPKSAGFNKSRGPETPKSDRDGYRPMVCFFVSLPWCFLGILLLCGDVCIVWVGVFLLCPGWDRVRI
jgi:hypothetical protein